jgi:two-component system sensor histidine kinase KdpD
LRIVVADRGIGVPQDAKELIFEKFYRAHEESAQSGIGLGLALCKSIILLHGGSIGVQDRDAGGSEFWVTLPLPDEAPRLAEQSLAS